MATRISRTNTTPTLSTKCTFSAWVKRTDTALNIAGRDAVLCENYIDANNYAWIRLDGGDKLNVYGQISGSNFVSISASAMFRDTNAWYHIVCVLDSTESTSTDRLKIYINGERQTALSGSTYPSGNVGFNTSGGTFILGDSLKYTSNFQFDGQYSHVHFIDGEAYQASTFGSTDSTTGEWKINTSPTITEYGANGFFMFKDDASLNDNSGKGNNFTVAAGSIQKTEDNPSNVFATLNPLTKGVSASAYPTFANGNTTITNTVRQHGFSSLGVSSGKWYTEFKITSGATSSVTGISDGSYTTYLGHGTGDYSYRGSDGTWYNNQSATSYGSALSDNDIVGVALDLDNNKLYFSINGTFQNSGDPTSGATGTGAISISAPATGFYHFATGNILTSGTITAQSNFGNGYFGTTAISSEGTNASGIGKFEYDVPTGYTALSTKGLNE